MSELASELHTVQPKALTPCRTADLCESHRSGGRQTQDERRKVRFSFIFHELLVACRLTSSPLHLQGAGITAAPSISEAEAENPCRWHGMESFTRGSCKTVGSSPAAPVHETGFSISQRLTYSDCHRTGGAAGVLRVLKRVRNGLHRRQKSPRHDWRGRAVKPVARSRLGKGQGM